MRKLGVLVAATIVVATPVVGVASSANAAILRDHGNAAILEHSAILKHQAILKHEAILKHQAILEHSAILQKSAILKHSAILHRHH